MPSRREILSRRLFLAPSVIHFRRAGSTLRFESVRSAHGPTWNPERFQPFDCVRPGSQLPGLSVRARRTLSSHHRFALKLRLLYTCGNTMSSVQVGKISIQTPNAQPCNTQCCGCARTTPSNPSALRAEDTRSARRPGTSLRTPSLAKYHVPPTPLTLSRVRYRRRGRSASSLR